MTTIDPRPATSIPATRTDAPAAASGDSGPETLSWAGQPQGWWSRNGLTLGMGVGAGVLAGVGALAIMTGRLNPTTNPTALIGGIAAATLGAGALAGGLTHWIRRSGDRLPEPPRGAVPHLPTAGSVPDVHGGEARAGMHVGHGDGSYTEQVPVTKTRSDGKGGTETYTDYETRTRYFDWDVGIQGQVGKREGYANMDEALRDLAEGDAVALRRQDDRIVAYDLQDRSHWGDVDDLRVDDQATEVIVSPSGRIWTRGETRDFHRNGETSRMDPTDIVGASVGEYEMRYHANPDVRVNSVRSGLLGYETLERALGEIKARGGDQVVVASHGRYHVADVRSPQLDRSVPNDGFVTSEDAQGVVAVEQQGGIWSPLGEWYVKPTQQLR